MKKRVATAVLGLSVIAIAGCGGGGEEKQVNYKTEIRSVPAPKLRTLSQRREDTKNETVLTLDTNARARWAEIRRLLFLDRPSKLTPEPMPH